jgi:hypothetical protein
MLETLKETRERGMSAAGSSYREMVKTQLAEKCSSEL